MALNRAVADADTSTNPEERNTLAPGTEFWPLGYRSSNPTPIQASKPFVPYVYVPWTPPAVVPRETHEMQLPQKDWHQFLQIIYAINTVPDSIMELIQRVLPATSAIIKDSVITLDVTPDDEKTLRETMAHYQSLPGIPLDVPNREVERIVEECMVSTSSQLASLSKEDLRLLVHKMLAIVPAPEEDDSTYLS
ncbi:hypothetical protein Ptr902_06196 [Pyrenophora tritici-repentis]|nr:hypothetical protein Ptr902_06196 [Pyrenophora tritici-repentis]